MTPVFSHCATDNSSLVQLRCFLLFPEHPATTCHMGEATEQDSA